jgi:phosphoribosylanthranilate isomerase
VLIKICGLTNPEDAAAATEAGADLLGFVFVPDTPRAVDAGSAGWVRDVRGGETVGVFRDAALDDILRIRDRLHLDRVQLHGNEPDAYLDALGDRVIRRLAVDLPIDWKRVAELARRCLPLFDPGAGDGAAWGWEALGDRPRGIEFGLAGGLGPESVAAAVRSVRPLLVDVSSGVERLPGVKDHRAVRQFVTAARNADAGLAT